MCHHILMYDGREKNTNSQINASINIYQTHIDVCDTKWNPLQLDNDKYAF